MDQSPLIVQSIVVHSDTRKKWAANVSYKGKTIYLGSYSTAEMAAKARDYKAKELHGQFAVLNFPEQSNV